MTNWASKLIEKKIEDGAQTRDHDGQWVPYAHKGDCILIDDLVLGVLEKNKEIEKELDYYELSKEKRKTSIDYQNDFSFAQARAFRELVEACSKASGDAQRGIEAMEKVKQK